MFEAKRLSRRDFGRLAAFIEEVAGISMPPSKQTMVEGRLRRRAGALGLANLQDYCSRLFDEGWIAEEAVHIIDAVTTNKTDFFREPEHFRFLADQALPDLLMRRHRPGLDRPLKMWSCASSIGAEPYSLAMVLDDFSRGHSGFQFRLVATDICTEVLSTARQAIYPVEMAAPIPPDFRRRYVLRSRDPEHGTVRMRPELRQAVQFGRLNLMEQSYPLDTDMDVIFCRNILIYFDKPRQQAVLERLCRHLRPGGYLFIGHTETVVGMELPIFPVTSAVFMRR